MSKLSIKKPTKSPRGSKAKYAVDQDIHVLGKELLDWLDDQKEFWHLSDWYYGVKKMLYTQWKSIIQRPEFLPYYKTAVKKMGTLMMKNKDMPTAYGSRFLAIYFEEVRELEKLVKFETIDHEAAVKADAESKKGVPPNDNSLDKLIDALKELKK